MSTNKKLYTKEELLLKKTDVLFFVKQEDLIAKPMPKGANNTFATELCYFLKAVSVKNDVFYKNQLEKARYTTEVCILDKKNKIIQRVPIVKIVMGVGGGIYFVIDRLAFTDTIQAKGSIY